MADEGRTIGRRIRRLRLQQGRTQDDLAGTCGFTKSMLCKIETGAVYPPVATLVKIAAALGTTLAALMEDGGQVAAVHIPAARAAAGATRTEKGYAVFPFATEYGSKKMQPFLFTARRGAVKRHALSHPGEEFIHVLEGGMKVAVGDVEYTLQTGDSLYFNAQEPHGIWPVTATVRYLNIFV